MSHLHPLGFATVCKIKDAQRVKSEKFEAALVKCHLLSYDNTKFRLLNGEKVIVSSDVEFPIEKAKNIFVEPQVDELDCILVDPAKAHQLEKQFSGLS